MKINQDYCEYQPSQHDKPYNDSIEQMNVDMELTDLYREFDLKYYGRSRLAKKI